MRVSAYEQQVVTDGRFIVLFQKLLLLTFHELVAKGMGSYDDTFHFYVVIQGG